MQINFMHGIGPEFVETQWPKAVAWWKERIADFEHIEAISNRREEFLES